ncbi:flavoprotein [Plantactinospora soyae]|uniref:Phosphopantothenoylcysteine synthetase/decarboxylase n=1 Tax=Plantactinospora soyae TaxID=1544732 RepID=A0A927M2E7_9ACTN|nr:flavoprotein [Plantactinospora soyae]MBE1486759.1 phosphopantothenoylcysteine synthetase/decarboxylase [Plantactinospora soyae]
MTEQRPVLYVVVCAAPPVLEVSELVELLMADAWTVCVITTPMAATWIDTRVLAEKTGYPVRSAWRRPGAPGALPDANAVLVAPATFNTINKWALGISDNFALGLLNELLGLRLPILVSPYAKKALTTHPAYRRHVQVLSDTGVVFTPSEALRPVAPSKDFQWRRLAEELARLRPS